MAKTTHGSLNDDALVDVAVQEVVRPVQGVDDPHSAHDPDLKGVVTAVQQSGGLPLGIMETAVNEDCDSPRPEPSEQHDSLEGRERG